MGRKTSSSDGKVRQSEAGKNVLDLKCKVKLKCDKISLDKLKSNTLANQYYN